MYFLIYDASGAVVGSGQKTVGIADPGTIECTDKQYLNPQAYAVSGGAVVAAPPAQIQAASKASANAVIKAQIAALEAGQQRAVREAAIGIAGSVARLQTLDASIVALRGKLV